MKRILYSIVFLGLFIVSPAVMAQEMVATITKGTFKIDLHARKLVINGIHIPVSSTNFDYIVTLIQNSPETVPYEKLVKDSQGYILTRNEAKKMVFYIPLHVSRPPFSESDKPNKLQRCCTESNRPN